LRELARGYPVLALAKAKQGCLVTLDHRVELSTVPGAAAGHLRLL